MTDEQRIREIRSRLLMAKALCAQANISLSTTGADTEFLLELIDRYRTTMGDVATELESHELYRYRADIHDPAEVLRTALNGGVGFGATN